MTASGGDTIAGNFIGTDVTGKLRAGSNTGLEIDSIGSVTVGGTTPGAGNVISGNVVGILSQQTTVTATNDLVEGNFIGTDVMGTQAADNVNGVELANDSFDTIGGTTAAAGNLISGNTFHGISVGLGSQVSTDTVVQGNDFGTDVTGGMGLSGRFSAASGSAVEIIGSSNTIGGAAAGAGNVIADNGFNAVEVAQGTSNLISRNAIYGNTPGGILVDSGANAGVTAPILTAAAPNGDGTVTVQGMLQNDTPGDTITIELFANAANPAAGQQAEGQTFLTSTTAAIDSSGNGSFTATVTPPAGEPFFTATATDSQNSTSVFSNSLAAVMGSSVQLVLSESVDPGTVAVGTNLGYIFAVANQGTSTATGVTLTHMLPASATFVSAVASQGTATQSAGTVTAALGTIAGGATATVRVVVQPQAIGSMIAIAGLIHADQFIDNPSQGATSIPVDVSPAPPTNVTTGVESALDGRKVVAVHWTYTNPPGSMATFNIYRAETPGGEGTTPYATGVTADQYTDLGAAPDQVYYYQVTAVAGGLESVQSAEVLGTILTAPTLTANVVPADATGTPMVNLAWASPGTASSSLMYVVTVADPAGSTIVYQGPNHSATIPQPPNSTFSYQVSAVVGSDVGPPSIPVAATTPDLMPLSIAEQDPSGPVQDTSGLSHGYDLTIAWEEPYFEASSVSYNIYRSTTPGGEGATPFVAGAAYSPTGSDVGGAGGGGGCSGDCGGASVFYRTQVEQEAGPTYYYQISEVVNVNGHAYVGPRSNELALTVPEPPSPSRIKQINILPNDLGTQGDDQRPGGRFQQRPERE